MREFDVVVIGSGPGGYVAAIRSAQKGLQTACIDKNPNLGGTCLNIGCIPSKSLLQSSEIYYQMKHHSAPHGIIGEFKLDFAQMMKRKEGVVSQFNGGIAALFKKNKVTFIQGTASFKDSTTLLVNDEEIKAKNIILATGSEPTPLPFLPFDEKRILSSTGALSLDQIPEKLVVIGAGVIGVELGSVYARLGSKVTFVEFLDRICPTLDRSFSLRFQKILEKQNLEFMLSSKVVSAEKKKSEILLAIEDNEGKKTLSATHVLVCVGRRPYTEGLKLEKANIDTSPQGFIPINKRFQTSVPHIFAIGDLVDGPMLAHKASEEGLVVADSIAGVEGHISYFSIPSVIYTHPEVAGVGLTEEEAIDRSIPIKIGEFPLFANSRAGCMGEKDGVVKLIADEKSNQLLGMHIIAPHAGELIHEGVLALEKRATVGEIANSSHAHPTLAEAIKEAALALIGKPIHF